jgi:hypothetical protein
MVNLRSPTREEIAEFIAGERLPRDRIDSLHDTITDIAETISVAIEGEHFSPTARKVRLKQIRGVRKGLEALDKLLSQSRHTTLLNRLLWSEVGSSLSTKSFERLGLPVADRISIHTLHSRMATGRTGPYPALEDAAMEERVSLAQQAGARVFAAALRRMAKRLESYVELERQNKGGRPAHVYRQYLIRQLAVLFPKLWHIEPTATLTGPFVRLCAFIMEKSDWPTDGLEDAIRRELNQRTNRRPAKPPSPAK